MNTLLRYQAPFLFGLVSFAALAVLNELRDFDLWRNYALSGIFLGAIAITLFHKSGMRIPHYIQWALTAGLLAHYVGGSMGSPDPYRMGLLGMHGVNGAYHHFDWWDNLTHFLGIGASAMGIAYLLEVYQTRRGLQWSASAVWIITLVASLAAGVGVELYEYLGKTAFQTIDQGGYENTMRDLHFNFLGAAVGGGIAVVVNRSRFRAAIEDQWGGATRVSRDEPWWRHTTPPMVGFVVFCAVPAAMAMFVMTAFFWMEIPPDDLHLYDPALQSLTWATVIAILAAPIGAATFRRYARRAG